VGIAISDGQRPDELIRDADAAMYRAKEQGPGRYEVFDELMRERVSGRLRIEASMRGAIERGELRAFYQPLVELTGGIIGAEALMRWEHPAWGWMRPGEFIPIAEQTDLIVPMGEWILGEACRQAVVWGDDHVAELDPAFSLSVNLSARQLMRPDLPSTVERIVEAAGVDPRRLALEITETTLIEEGNGPIERLRALRSLGVQIVLDDFGTGYSSLTYLSRLPIDVLKLDRSFVARLGGEDGAPAAAIVTAVMSMAAALGLRVVAEGVETPEQVDRLQELGCFVAQGFHFARPMASPAFSELLKGPLLPADEAVRQGPCSP
jgi:EAL domain-containing protein (putative c-di-GMP-specific phosphodiesterase class I)